MQEQSSPAHKKEEADYAGDGMVAWAGVGSNKADTDMGASHSLYESVEDWVRSRTQREGLTRCRCKLIEAYGSGKIQY
jgi:hypothetical protein